MTGLISKRGIGTAESTFIAFEDERKRMERFPLLSFCYVYQ